MERITAEAREDILVQALLTCPNLTEVSRKTNIPRPTIYTVINTDSFRKKYTEARDKAVTTAIASELNKRKYVGYEISKEYCQIAKKRIAVETSTLF